MDGALDKVYEISNLSHEISERETIIYSYSIYASLDRNIAIEKYLVCGTQIKK